MKTEVAHTPGPWSIGAPDENGGLAIYGGADAHHAQIVAGSVYTRADAALVAAAPELLEQLKAWNTWAETLPGGIETFEKFARKQNNWADAPIPAHARAAIAKAEGR